MSKVILVFAMASDKKEAIRLIGEELGIKVRDMIPREYNQQIGYLAGITGMKRAAGKYKGPDFEEEMMVLCGMNSQDIDVLLAKCKDAGIARVDRKAGITPTNAYWTPLQLYEELGEEHRRMHQG